MYCVILFDIYVRTGWSEHIASNLFSIQIAMFTPVLELDPEIWHACFMSPYPALDGGGGSTKYIYKVPLRDVYLQYLGCRKLKRGNTGVPILRAYMSLFVHYAPYTTVYNHTPGDNVWGSK